MEGQDNLEHFISTEYGWCYYLIWDKSIPGPYIYNLFVGINYRNHGCAKRLLQMVIDEIHSLLGESARIYIRAIPFDDEEVSKEKLIEFYEKMGLIVLEDNNE